MHNKETLNQRGILLNSAILTERKKVINLYKHQSKRTSIKTHRISFRLMT